MRNKHNKYARRMAYRFTAAITALAAACLLAGCGGPAVENAFRATPKRFETAKTAKPSAPSPAAAPPLGAKKPAQAAIPADATPKPQIKRPPSIGFNAMRHFKNAMKAAEKSQAEALISFNLALASEPYFTEARYNLGIIMLKLGNKTGAKAELEKAAETNFAEGSVYSALGLLYIDEKNYAGAAEAMLKAATSEPNNPKILVNLASAYSLMGNLELAGKTYAKAEAKSPDDAYLNYNIGIEHMKTKEYGKAAARFKKSLAIKDSVPETALAYAEALFKMGEYSEAEKAYVEAARLHPNAATPHINLGILYELYLNDFKKAEESYSKYLELDGKHANEVKQWIELLKEKSKP